ncbi:hypothetical protein FQN54_007730 [Arachnomyces sp. PD_36]|nr:hypothetical protein FQN54_007730 [Arachnomyces sp. PD_36]
MRVLHFLPFATYLALATALPHLSRQDGFERRAFNPLNVTRAGSDDYGLLQPEAIVNDPELVYKSCDDPLVSDVEIDPQEVWAGLGCSSLYVALWSNWTMEKEDTDLSFSQHIANRMHAPPNWICEDIDDAPCNSADLQCDDTFFACGHMIMNSLANVHNQYNRPYQKMLEAHDRLQDIVGFSFRELFCPEMDDDEMDMLALVVGLLTAGQIGISGIVETWLKKALQSAVKANFGVVKDGIMHTTAMAQPFATAGITDDLEGDSSDAKLTELLGRIYDRMRDTQRELVKSLFSQEDSEAVLGLRYLIEDGASMRSSLDADWESLDEDIMKLFLGLMIPNAWSIAPKFADSQYKTWSNPFVVNSNLPCGQKPEMFDYYDQYKGFHEICYNGEGWYMLMVEESAVLNSYSGSQYTYEFYEVPGIEQLTSKDGYYGVKAEDILASSVEGWKKNGEKQGYTIPEDESLVVPQDDSAGELRYTGGIQQPGFFSLSVCPDWDTMMPDRFAEDLMTSQPAPELGSSDLCRHPRTLIMLVFTSRMLSTNSECQLMNPEKIYMGLICLRKAVYQGNARNPKWTAREAVTSFGDPTPQRSHQEHSDLGTHGDCGPTR